MAVYEYILGDYKTAVAILIFSVRLSAYSLRPCRLHKLGLGHWMYMSVGTLFQRGVELKKCRLTLRPSCMRINNLLFQKIAVVTCEFNTTAGVRFQSCFLKHFASLLTDVVIYMPH